jgi:hypothetical protein
MNLAEAMTVVDMGGTVTRRSWFGEATVYLDRDEIVVKSYENGPTVVYDPSEDKNSDDWEMWNTF